MPPLDIGFGIVFGIVMLILAHIIGAGIGYAILRFVPLPVWGILLGIGWTKLEVDEGHIAHTIIIVIISLIVVICEFFTQKELKDNNTGT